MATWQFDVQLVPHAEVRTLYEAPFEPEAIIWHTEADESAREWWGRHQPLPGNLEAFDALAPRTPTWSDELRQWGSEEGNRIDVWYEDGRVAEILIRTDLRAPDAAFIDGIANVAQDVGCDFLTPDGLLAEGDAASLAILLRNSPALRFVRDPLAFLQRVRVGGEDA